MNSPCNGCQDRDMACWDKCRSYKVFKTINNAIAAKIRKAGKEDNAIYEQQRNRYKAVGL